MRTAALDFEQNDMDTSSKSFGKIEFALRRVTARRFYRALYPQPVRVLAVAGSCIIRHDQDEDTDENMTSMSSFLNPYQGWWK